MFTRNPQKSSRHQASNTSTTGGAASPDTADAQPCADETSATDCETATSEHSSQSRRSRPTLGVVIVATAVIGLILCALFDRLGSALFFVGVPCLLAAGIGTISAKTSYGRVMQITTIALLLMSALLHEAAFCLLLAAPIIYLAAAAGLWIRRRWGSQRTTHAVAIPIILLLAAEGISPQLRVGELQETSATATYAGSCDSLTTRLLDGPQSIKQSRHGLLKIAPYPTPAKMQQHPSAPHTDSSAFNVGQTWKTAIGPGALTSKVTDTSPQSVTFAVTEDKSKAQRWVDLHSARLSWKPSDDNCNLTVRVLYSRKLDPGLWFGPITHAFTHDATVTLANSLVTTQHQATQQRGAHPTAPTPGQKR